ncbi:hypothetical protein AMK31_33955 [Streptomyces sp. TSRI0107]|nr:hypothetical protein AMK31_33955 [Streptomyces sp. TSRI0107]
MRWCRSSAVRARVTVTGVVLGALAALTASPASPAPRTSADADDHSYAFAEDARRVPGATTTTGAAPLRPGGTYRSTLPADGTAYYRLDLDATSNAYVAATAVPGPDAGVSASDGVDVSVQDGDGRSCSYDRKIIGSSRSPRPITAWGARETGGTRCADSGTYYVVVERVRPGGATAGSAPEPWELELTVVTEPQPARPGATDAPRAWDSASPVPPADEPERRPGGAGFDTAATVGQGGWSAEIEPGQTLFYEVPVDWGQQLSATAELGSAGGDDRHDYAVGALNLALHNPVRALVVDDGTGYDGRQQSASLDPLPPVDFANRYATADRVSGMRFAGSYYLVVHLAAQVAEKVGPGPFGLTLRVRVKGDPQDGPLYADRSVPEGLFDLTEGEREASADSAGGDGVAMKAVAAGGFGAGTLILVGLAVWTVRGRRRSGAVAG